MRASFSARSQRGALLIEVLVTIVILAIGLLGLAGLQARLQLSEMESYQHAQALILLNDMSSRIATNRNAALGYVTATALGAGMTCPAATATATQREQDTREWCVTLQGAAEKSGANDVGAMVGGRGCVQSAGANTYMVTVAWQGLVPISAPPASVVCGQNQYNTAGTSCINDLCRRAITTIVRIATL